MQFDFELIYKEYPRREHKTRGFKILAKKIKTEDDYHNLARAVENYAKLIKLEQRERKYTMMWTTFCNNYEDYIDPADLGLSDYEDGPALVFE